MKWKKKGPSLSSSIASPSFSDDDVQPEPEGCELIICLLVSSTISLNTEGWFDDASSSSSSCTISPSLSEKQGFLTGDKDPDTQIITSEIAAYFHFFLFQLIKENSLIYGVNSDICASTYHQHQSSYDDKESLVQ